MNRKIIDAASLASVAVLFGVAVWLAVGGEGPRGADNLSIQSKIVLLDMVPFSFGFFWLLFRYGATAVKRFPRVFGPRGMLFYFALIVGGAALIIRWSAVLLSGR